MVSYVCLDCGRELARTMPLGVRDKYHASVHCPKCGRASVVRYDHPLVKVVRRLEKRKVAHGNV